MNIEKLNKHRIRTGSYGSTDELGFTGAFKFMIDGTFIGVIACDEGGWEHVSVSLIDHPNTCPKWNIMCEVKDLFWEPEDIVVQFHPKKSEYISNHPGVLHMWRCIDGRGQPMPPSIMVGIKELGTLSMHK